MTIDTIKLFSKYNSHANSGMNKVISLLSPYEWEKEFDGYYKNIRSLCAHIYNSDFTWLKRFGSLKRFHYMNNAIFGDVLTLESTPFITINEYITKRNELDSMIDSFVNEVTLVDLDEILVYKNFRNVEQKRNFGGLILHMFNHQTHHRGMISVYLELLGKENDFSNLFNLI